MRGLLGFLYSTPAYWPSLEMFGWQDRGERLQAMTRAGEWQRMAEVVDDEMMEAFVPRGTYGHIDTVYRERFGGLAGRVTFPVPADPAHDEQAAEVIARLRD
jgi:hypothetical protein